MMTVLYKLRPSKTGGVCEGLCCCCRLMASVYMQPNSIYWHDTYHPSLCHSATQQAGWAEGIMHDAAADAAE